MKFLILAVLIRGKIKANISIEACHKTSLHKKEKNNILMGKKNLAMNVSSSKIGHDFTNKVVQKLTQEKNVFNKKWSPKLIFLDEFFFGKI